LIKQKYSILKIFVTVDEHQRIKSFYQSNIYQA